MKRVRAFEKNQVARYRAEYSTKRTGMDTDEFVRKLAVHHRCSITAVYGMLAGRGIYAELDKGIL